MGRVVVWAAASLAIALAGLVAVACVATLAVPLTVDAGDASPVDAGAHWALVFAVIGRQALLPHLGGTLLTYLIAARLLPSLERGIGRIWLGLAAVAALLFPAVGAFSFTAWEPGGWANYLATWMLLVAATSSTLALPRRLVPALRPVPIEGRGGHRRPQSG